MESQQPRRALTMKRASLRRRAEEVNYWRQRAGWFDDDESMKEYNSGIYDAYYQDGDDDMYVYSGGSNNSGVGTNMRLRNSSSAAIQNTIKILSVIVSIALIFFIARVITRRMNGDKDKKKSKKNQRSPSRSRSRSRSRRSDGGYDLMDDDDGRSRKSARSSRSRSKRRKSRSRSRQRSRSRGHTEDKPRVTEEPEKKKEAVLV